MHPNITKIAAGHYRLDGTTIEITGPAKSGGWAGAKDGWMIWNDGAYVASFATLKTATARARAIVARR